MPALLDLKALILNKYWSVAGCWEGSSLLSSSRDGSLATGGGGGHVPEMTPLDPPMMPAFLDLKALILNKYWSVSMLEKHVGKALRLRRWFLSNIMSDL